MSTLAPAPIQFVTPRRDKDTALIGPARLLSVAEVAATLDVRLGGIALFAVEDGNVAIRVGREDTGIVGYASAEHGIAFVNAVITALTDEARAKGIAKREAQRIREENAAALKAQEEAQIRRERERRNESATGRPMRGVRGDGGPAMDGENW